MTDASHRELFLENFLWDENAMSYKLCTYVLYTDSSVIEQNKWSKYSEVEGVFEIIFEFVKCSKIITDLVSLV